MITKHRREIHLRLRIWWLNFKESAFATLLLWLNVFLWTIVLLQCGAILDK